MFSKNMSQREKILILIIKNNQYNQQHNKTKNQHIIKLISINIVINILYSLKKELKIELINYDGVDDLISKIQGTKKKESGTISKNMTSITKNMPQVQSFQTDLEEAIKNLMHNIESKRQIKESTNKINQDRGDKSQRNSFKTKRVSLPVTIPIQDAEPTNNHQKNDSKMQSEGVIFQKGIFPIQRTARNSIERLNNDSDFVLDAQVSSQNKFSYSRQKQEFREVINMVNHKAQVYRNHFSSSNYQLNQLNIFENDNVVEAPFMQRIKQLKYQKTHDSQQINHSHKTDFKDLRAISVAKQVLRQSYKNMDNETQDFRAAQNDPNQVRTFKRSKLQLNSEDSKLPTQNNDKIFKTHSISRLMDKDNQI